VKHKTTVKSFIKCEINPDIVTEMKNWVTGRRNNRISVSTKMIIFYAKRLCACAATTLTTFWYQSFKQRHRMWSTRQLWNLSQNVRSIMYFIVPQITQQLKKKWLCKITTVITGVAAVTKILMNSTISHTALPLNKYVCVHLTFRCV